MPARHHPGRLVDTAVIHVRAGRGGRGSASFRHEPFVPKGGPDGGDGGSGGSVVLHASGSVSSLAALARRRDWKAGEGAAGAGGRKEGKRGEDLRLVVPPGTQVIDQGSGEVLGDLDREGASLVIAAGGTGGRGNIHFATPVNRAPRLAEPGQPGEERTVRLELKLIADVGLVGAPNAGKSSLLAALTAAHPKIADYPFTTLDPQLGVLEDAAGRRLVLADIPGLIEGAAGGAGLGLEFLRHIERTRLLLYVADGAADDPWGDLDRVRAEVDAYLDQAVERPHLVVLNKIDLPGVREVPDAPEQPSLRISAWTGEGLAGLVAEISRALPLVAPPPLKAPSRIRLPKARVASREITVIRHSWGFELAGPRIERLVEMTDFDSEPALERFQVLLDRMAVNAALEREGVTPGDTVRIGDLEFEYQP